MQDSINKQRWEKKKLRRKQNKKQNKICLIIIGIQALIILENKTKQKKKSHLNKQTLEPNFYNDSVQIRKLTTICRRINRKSAVYSCLILSTKSSLTCFTTLYWQQLNIVRRMKFMKKKIFFFSEFPKQHDYFDTRRRKKKRKRKSRPKSKIKNIVILINCICLNLFE